MKLPKEKAFEFWLSVIKETDDLEKYRSGIMWMRTYFDELLYNNINNL